MTKPVGSYYIQRGGEISLNPDNRAQEVDRVCKNLLKHDPFRKLMSTKQIDPDRISAISAELSAQDEIILRVSTETGASHCFTVKEKTDEKIQDTAYFLMGLTNESPKFSKSRPSLPPKLPAPAPAPAPQAPPAPIPVPPAPAPPAPIPVPPAPAPAPPAPAPAPPAPVQDLQQIFLDEMREMRRDFCQQLQDHSHRSDARLDAIAARLLRFQRDLAADSHYEHARLLDYFEGRDRTLAEQANRTQEALFRLIEQLQEREQHLSDSSEELPSPRDSRFSDPETGSDEDVPPPFPAPAPQAPAAPEEESDSDSEDEINPLPAQQQLVSAQQPARANLFEMRDRLWPLFLPISLAIGQYLFREDPSQIEEISPVEDAQEFSAPAPLDIDLEPIEENALWHRLTSLAIFGAQLLSRGRPVGRPPASALRNVEKVLQGLWNKR